MLIVVVAALLIGGAFIFAIWRRRRKAAAAESWPSVPGRITASEVVTRRDEGQLEHQPHIAYTFDVGGRTYAGSRVTFGLTRYGLGPAKALCARYPVGSGVTVHYDPADPSSAVLVRRGAA